MDWGYLSLMLMYCKLWIQAASDCFKAISLLLSAAERNGTTCTVNQRKGSKVIALMSM